MPTSTSNLPPSLCSLVFVSLKVANINCLDLIRSPHSSLHSKITPPQSCTPKTCEEKLSVLLKQLLVCFCLLSLSFGSLTTQRSNRTNQLPPKWRGQLNQPSFFFSKQKANKLGGLTAGLLCHTALKFICVLFNVEIRSLLFRKADSCTCIHAARGCVMEAGCVRYDRKWTIIQSSSEG